MEYEQSDLLKWLRNRAILEESDATTWQLKHAAGTIERLQKERDAGRELMRQAWHEFNAIRARDGAPVGVSEEWWSQMTEELGKLLGDEAKPWMSDAAQALLAPSHAEICEMQDRVIKAEQERDAALAEVERLKARLDIIPVATGSPRCKLCGVLLSGDLEKQFCSTCCAQ